MPYQPSSPRQVANALALLRGRAGKTVDLGSGDGRLVRAGSWRGLGCPGWAKGRDGGCTHGEGEGETPTQLLPGFWLCLWVALLAMGQDHPRWSQRVLDGPRQL